MKFSLSFDTEPLEYINSVILFALWLDVFVVDSIAHYVKNSESFIVGILDFCVVLESKAFGLS